MRPLFLTSLRRMWSKSASPSRSWIMTGTCICVLTDEQSCLVICKAYSIVVVLMPIRRGKSDSFKTHLFHVIIYIFFFLSKKVTVKLKNGTPGAGERMGTQTQYGTHYRKHCVKPFGSDNRN